ncbi:hypothetical protein NP493_870g01028 [Ridgeia piscesae]|uniref:BTB domain-containing protein n=1 Tax=Ridgeia piscesae TaxID=27915 RepID=A0AAD9NKC9_RIDPI|nr:hypothetical protein NP493_870g01028 [Ridgeia piscesae]
MPLKVEPEDWQNSRGVLASNRYMLDNQIECDVQFVICTPDGARVFIPAHSYVLISRSPVFHAMLNGPLAENKKEIRICDVTPEAFNHLLGYLYCEETCLCLENVFCVLYVAKKYLVPALTRQCISFLVGVLSPDNVCTILDHSLLFEGEPLEHRCLQMVQRYSKRVFPSKAFCDISNDTLCKILQSECLSVPEVEVFRACVRWAETKCVMQEVDPTAQNKRAILGPALYLIHFPCVSLFDFSKTVAPSGLLTMQEENAIFRYLNGGISSDEILSKFPCTSREIVSFKCSAEYDGFARHSTAQGTAYEGRLQRSRWSLAVHCDHSIEIHELGFAGDLKGSVAIFQDGIRKLEVSCDSPVREIPLDDVVALDAGVFTIFSDEPFTYSGIYYYKKTTSPAPRLHSDNDTVSFDVRDFSAMCIVEYFNFTLTNELYFVENYFLGDVA